jgi:hypothetical protein
MKKETLIQKINNRFSNLPQDVAVVVIYKGKKYSICPDRFQEEWFINRTTIDVIKPFYYGEIVEEKQELCPNPEYQYLTFRAEAACDAWGFAYHLNKNNEDIMLLSFQVGESVFGFNTGKLYAPFHLSLVQVKELMWELADKYEIHDAHVLIQSLDYPVFEGQRDRNSPQPVGK